MTRRTGASDAEDRKAVRIAARMLDARKPNWFRRIVFKRLDISSACYCICGQNGIPWEPMHNEFVTLHPNILNTPFTDNDLRDEWIDEIRARRAKVKS